MNKKAVLAALNEIDPGLIAFVGGPDDVVDFSRAASGVSDEVWIELSQWYLDAIQAKDTLVVVRVCKTVKPVIVLRAITVNDQGEMVVRMYNLHALRRHIEQVATMKFWLSARRCADGVQAIVREIVAGVESSVKSLLTLDEMVSERG